MARRSLEPPEKILGEISRYGRRQEPVQGGPHWESPYWHCYRRSPTSRALLVRGYGGGCVLSYYGYDISQAVDYLMTENIPLSLPRLGMGEAPFGLSICRARYYDEENVQFKEVTYEYLTKEDFERLHKGVYFFSNLL